ncbi:hypothetical protein [Roseibium sp.]|uniref:hypothetical protein n=1 Tax=Roseibium sp. TaxID=1936156 RepID=UPI003D0F1B7D
MVDSVSRTLGFTPAWEPVPKPQQVQWPPLGHRGEYDVSKGEQDWTHAALVNLIGDPRDLVFFNFKTLNAKRVNWYLHHYVGCWRSRDKKNFDFKDAMPGKIFLPPFGWSRHHNKIPTGLKVYSQLVRISSNYPRLVWLKRGYSVSPEELMTVANLIKKGDIPVVEDSVFLKKHSAYGAVKRAHGPDGDKLILVVRDDWSPTQIDMHTLVHEATHLLIHQKRKDSTTVEHELMARCAAEIWLYRTDRNAQESVLFTPSGDITRTTYGRRLGRLLAQSAGNPKVVDVFDKVVAHDTKSYGRFPEERTGVEHYNVVEELITAIKQRYKPAELGIYCDNPHLRRGICE